MVDRYTSEQRKQIREISSAFESLARREDVDYRQHDANANLNLDQLLDYWKYRVKVFASKKHALCAPPGKLSAIIENLGNVKDALEQLLSDIPPHESADNYLDSNLRKINGELSTNQSQRSYQQGQRGSLSDEFNELYWQHIPDDFSVKEIVKEIRVEKLETTLTGGADLEEAYHKSERVVLQSLKRMRTVCGIGIVLLVVIAATSAVAFKNPLPFQTTLPINLLILLYCSVEIRRYLIDAKNRDLCRVRLREFNALPPMLPVDTPVHGEIVKSWYHAFNKLDDKDLTWADIVKPILNRFLNPSQGN